ncbi:PadR family transcriptional regulator [Pseudarthrobacter sp. AL07]|uniref:PadR family transcriptional regulator n=1 Tax=unclassified Pseudarthrobacter TaxID=2647000 RepID=UPI00249AEB48|nr:MULTISPECIES: PadR family transcriptional regulator [unclassified Pseudarthrobacter]MDI3194454.1 PadR family transcriptional regulator [Pseudarthrobacter sp. AL20]MDI3208521.1 PadR family transcriptional regulator [Pseudarthrobacter sp. AL07]
MKGIHDDKFLEPTFGRGRFERGRGRRGPHGHRGGGFGPGFGPGGGFGPGFGPGPRRASRGDVRWAILSLLAESPSNGYGLIKTIAEKTSGAWRPSPGSIYPTLQQLVDEDLIEPLSEGRRTDFTLTDAGKAYVAEHAEELENAWNSDAEGSGQAFHQSVGKLMGVIHQFRTAATEEQRNAAVEKLDETRRALYQILAD